MLIIGFDAANWVSMEPMIGLKTHSRREKATAG